MTPRPLRPATTTKMTRKAEIVRILIVGASGLIGSAVVAHLGGQGHEIVMATRIGSPAGLLPAKIIRMDLARATSPEDWLPHLTGIDAVINCAGTFQDSPGESTAAVHIDGISALFRACERAGVRRVVHLSAVEVDREAPTKFSQTKLAGDRALMERDLDWVILRPSVVVGRAAYGGSALFRGLAALPVMPVVPRTGALQLVHLDDVVKAIAFFVTAERAEPPCGRPRGPATLDVRGLSCACFAPGCGWRSARVIRSSGLGGERNVSPGRSCLAAGMASADAQHGTAGDSCAAPPATPASLTPAHRHRSPIDIEKDPGGSARLGSGTLVRPALFLSSRLCSSMFALFWITTGLISLGPGWEIGIGPDARGWGRRDHGAPLRSSPARSSVCHRPGDRFRPTARYGLYAALTISITYAIIGTWLVPRLWIDPLGPMLKIWPIMVFNLVALAILEDR